MPNDRNEIAVREQTPNLMGGLEPTNAPMVPVQQTEKFMVILARAGVGGKKYFVPPGSTVGDLLRAAEATAENQDLMVGPNKVTVDTVLQPNTLLFTVPRPKNA